MNNKVFAMNAFPMNGGIMRGSGAKLRAENTSEKRNNYAKDIKALRNNGYYPFG